MIYLRLFYEFFKIGLFTFGGGFAMIPLVEDAAVNNGWLTSAEFYDLIGVCESTPGPIAVNMATYIGSLQGGIFGSFCATLAVVLPSFLIILLIAAVLKNFTENKFFKGFIKGVKPVIAALILATGASLLFKNIGFISLESFKFDWISVLIFLCVVLLYFLFKEALWKKLSAIQIILISAGMGIVFCSIFKG